MRNRAKKCCFFWILKFIFRQICIAQFFYQVLSRQWHTWGGPSEKKLSVFRLRTNPDQAEKKQKASDNNKSWFLNSLFSKTTGLSASMESSVDSFLLAEEDYLKEKSRILLLLSESWYSKKAKKIGYIQIFLIHSDFQTRFTLNYLLHFVNRVTNR